jgi:uncharacterized membrane protein YgdD (TMEM256/DUF423 family)
MNSTNTGHLFVALGAISGFLSVAFGAFGAHALKSRVEEHLLDAYQTGAQYQMYHALALVGLGLWCQLSGDARAQVAGWAWVVGTLLFSGSLYALALTGIRGLGAITPLGGLSFMAGWLILANRAIQVYREN